jgi:hypothetical protein
VKFLLENLRRRKKERFSLYYAAFCFRAFNYGINGHAREYALEYTIDYMSQREALEPQ